MKRKCDLVFKSPDGKRAIYIDRINGPEINRYLRLDDQHKKAFQKFVNLFLNGLHNPDIYKKEDINEFCKDVTVIRFFVGHDNDGLYCKEIKKGSNTIITIMSVLHLRKTTQKNKGREIKSIETVASYEYEIE